MVPSNWCMNWAQPTMSGTMTEKRAGEGDEDIGLVCKTRGRRASLGACDYSIASGTFLRGGGKARSRSARSSARELEVVGRAVGADMRRLDRLRDRDHAAAGAGARRAPSAPASRRAAQHRLERRVAEQPRQRRRRAHERRIGHDRDAFAPGTTAAGPIRCRGSSGCRAPDWWRSRRRRQAPAASSMSSVSKLLTP